MSDLSEKKSDGAPEKKSDGATGKKSDSANLQILVDCFDDIPSIMSKLNVSLNDSPTRYKAMGRNSSISVERVMRANERLDVSQRENAHRVERMATQAMRVLDQLARIPEAKRKPKRNPAETAAIAKEKLVSLENTGTDLNKFYQQYDVHRNGKISYKDFNDTLLAVSAGLTREETHQLASQLDVNRVGSIEYSTVLEALSNLAPSPPPYSSSSVPIHDQTQDRQPSSESKSQECESLLPPPPPPNNADSKKSVNKVTPKTSFTQVGSATAPALENDNYPIGNVGEPTSSVAPSSPSHPLSDRHSTQYSPTKSEIEARGVIARRFFHNPNVNTVLYGDQGQLSPYQFDRREPPQVQLNASRRRAVSAPGRARCNIKDSGCNLTDDVPYPVHEYGGIIRKSTSSTPESVSVDESIILDKIRHNPFFKADAQVERLRTAVLNQEKSTLTSAVVDQIAGGVDRLRHTLKKHDASGSGLLNTEEFKFALKRAGVHLSTAQYNELYNQSAREVAESNIHGYSRGKAVDIEAFTHKIQEAVKSTSNNTINVRNRTPTAEFTQKYGDKYVVGDAAKNLEKVRVMKKVLQSSAKLSNPHAVYNHIAPKHNGFLNEAQMQDALLHMGANLSSNEFGVLMQNIPKDKYGKIELSRFESALRSEVGQYDKATAQESDSLHRKFRHYSCSFRNSADFSLAHPSNTEFDPLCHQRGYAEETEISRRWGQLQDIFQRNPEAVLGAFSVAKAQSPDRKSLRAQEKKILQVELADTKSVSVHELKNRLAQSGLPLSEDDILRVERTLVRSTENEYTVDSKQEKDQVSLERFCKVVGLDVQVKDKHLIAVENVHQRAEDGGVFRESLITQHINPTVSTTFYEGNSASADRVGCTGDRRKRHPTSIRGNESDPANFWEIVDAVRTDVGKSRLFPSPMPTFRSSVPPSQKAEVSLDQTAASRGVVRVSPTAEYVKLVGRTEGRLQEEYIGRRNAAAAVGDTSGPRRSLSAPPRTLLRSSGMLNNSSHGVASLLQHADGGAGGEQYSTSSRSASTAGLSSVAEGGSNISTSARAHKADIAAKIAKWGSGPLASYYESRERLNLGGDTRNNESVSPSRRSKSSLRRQHTQSAGTSVGGAGSGGSVKSGSSASGVSGSVSDNAPFATGATYM